jgi:hypothetical protein
VSASSTPDDIRRLLDEYLSLYESEENRRRLRYWEIDRLGGAQWHPRPRRELFRREGLCPITADLQNSFWLQLLPQDLGDCYRDPLVFLRFQLQKRIAAFRQVRDDTPLDRILPIYLISAFEASLFGMPVHYFPDRDPIVDPNPVVRSLGDLARLPPVDFQRSGLMPLAIRFYEQIREWAGDALTVIFPEWIRGPFGVALPLRGYQDLLVDLLVDPVFAQALLERITSTRQDWYRARARYLNEPLPAGSLFNDEVDADVFAPRLYAQHVLPYEQALARFHGRVTYWHSCGNIAPMAVDIASLPGLDMLDIGPWTDLAQVLQSLQGRIPRLEIRLHPLTDVQSAPPAWMEERIGQVVGLCREHAVGAWVLRVDGLAEQTNPAQDLAHVQRWIDTARRVLSSM